MAFKFESMNKQGNRTMCKGVDSRALGDIKNLKDFVGCVVAVDGFFFSHSTKYDNDQVVIAGTVMAKDDSGEWQRVGQFLMNTPGRTYNEFKEMAEDQEALESILRGELIMTNIEMADTKSGSTVIYKYRTGKPRYELEKPDDFLDIPEDDDIPFI